MSCIGVRKCLLGRSRLFASSLSLRTVLDAGELPNNRYSYTVGFHGKQPYEFYRGFWNLSTTDACGGQCGPRQRGSDGGVWDRRWDATEGFHVKLGKLTHICEEVCG